MKYTLEYFIKRFLIIFNEITILRMYIIFKPYLLTIWASKFTDDLTFITTSNDNHLSKVYFHLKLNLSYLLRKQPKIYFIIYLICGALLEHLILIIYC